MTYSKNILKKPLALIVLSCCLIIKSNTAVASERCLSVPPRLVSIISEKLENTTAKAVKSNDFENVYFIAAQSKSTGTTGVWTSNVIEAKSGMIMAANDIAVELSAWPDARTSQMRINKYDDGYFQALECLSK